MTRTEMIIVVDKLARAFSKQVTENTASIFYSAAGQYSRFQVMRAAMRLISKNRYFPHPSELVAEIKKNKELEPKPFDEFCLWRMFLRDLTDPGELTESDIAEARKLYDSEVNTGKQR